MGWRSRRCIWYLTCNMQPMTIWPSSPHFHTNLSSHGKSPPRFHFPRDVPSSSCLAKWPSALHRAMISCTSRLQFSRALCQDATALRVREHSQAARTACKALIHIWITRARGKTWLKVKRMKLTNVNSGRFSGARLQRLTRCMTLASPFQSCLSFEDWIWKRWHLYTSSVISAPVSHPPYLN